MCVLRTVLASRLALLVRRVVLVLERPTVNRQVWLLVRMWWASLSVLLVLVSVAMFVLVSMVLRMDVVVLGRRLYDMH